MAGSFGADTSVLWYGPRPHADPGPRNERQYLLWPAWAFRVVAPEPRERRLNLIQKAVLSLLRASRLTGVEIAERLGIHKELSAFVALELQSMGCVDDAWTVTKAGLEMIQEEREDSASLIPGWVFQDPWKGELWPFVARSLECARTERGDNGYPLLDLGTTGKPWLQRAWLQKPSDDGFPGPPAPHEILRASLRHGRLVSRTRHLTLWTEDDVPAEPARFDIDRVSVIDARPEPVLLTTFLYVARRGADPEIDWHACDFFGRGTSPELRRLVARAATHDSGLAARVDRLVGRTYVFTDFADLQAAFAEWRRLARFRLERALTADVTRHEVAEPLTQALEACVQVDQLGDGAPSACRRDALVACRITLEKLFGDLARQWPLAGMADLLGTDRELNEATLGRAVAEVGLAEVPPALWRVQPGQVRSVCDFPGAWKLRPLVAATILCAARRTEHPLRAAATRVPDLLVHIEHIAARAGEAAHGGDVAAIGIDDVRACIDATLIVVGNMLGLPVRSLSEVESDGQEES